MEIRSFSADVKVRQHSWNIEFLWQVYENAGEPGNKEVKKENECYMWNNDLQGEEGVSGLW